MSLILNLETSTTNCSVSIAKNGVCIASIEENSDQYLHSEKLHTFIQYAIKISKIDINDLQSICVSKGPGSYTSLRIGISAAKGLCYSLGIPLLSLDALTVMSQKVDVKDGFLIPMIHAKSDLFYTSLFNESKKRLCPISIKKFNEDSFKSITKDKKVYIFGNINLTERKLFTNLFHFIHRIYPSAMDMSFLSYVKFCDKKFNNIEKFIPFYL
ncbi:MAG: tRNA (adenosine(37)-N6)-threonylcarbamoyltransferase complex dimerization subunit type 1 TsaB [Flavobacteriales bacterium]|jgi:tRNA threonylcarbamoyladenosine biosynthesis protein TsaB|uniref:tRNA (adenosine(37)-N6)-threonylcarbamoyltransferase complex dimerization subunit type 1 TsaB n=1 Tax=Blattabacterium sp. (Mastotermes darwiniensis) TaxID=39768 RepID=UPI000231DE20|nr:tRNA (adenosine(37)-N6)-threonylcarbamoyltransferase complex dimerization subunit type 1 TsaB [Blattabacterium sp. (Mastotermes darwiniensis)]AER40596.1 peptidase M22, glycoprotease [Blattabacterium sp. (Mastotermes darwiniensis) str. MADAR]MDR1805093.1 tRNA (adenosine(37)-N6)-threonylcarbamoyltransferase complex dimerization subunit type 1 TsaB [Flavobacteriales bacterium]